MFLSLGYEDKMFVLVILVIPVHVPWQNVSFPLQTALASQCLTRDPLRINPGSHANVNEFGKVVRYSPTRDPLTGVWREPQSFAMGEKKDSKQVLKTKISYWAFFTFKAFYYLHKKFLLHSTLHPIYILLHLNLLNEIHRRKWTTLCWDMWYGFHVSCHSKVS